jgi:hypothetical protein
LGQSLFSKTKLILSRCSWFLFFFLIYPKYAKPEDFLTSNDSEHKNSWNTSDYWETNMSRKRETNDMLITRLPRCFQGSLTRHWTSGVLWSSVNQAQICWLISKRNPEQWKIVSASRHSPKYCLETHTTCVCTYTNTYIFYTTSNFDCMNQETFSFHGVTNCWHHWPFWIVLD